jgi:nitroimidazol reductase NimA-like FMN-containing flavoprotein (pyridoxamine 5'-phosphate oxidase superfamily)
MQIREMTQMECRAVLERASMGRLGCSLDGQPYIVPVFLAYEPDYIYVFSTFGQKIEWMRANPKVCIEIDEIMKESEWASVIVNGRYQELPEPQYEAERARARELLGKQHQWWLNALEERRTKMRENLIEPLFFRIQITSKTGLCTAAEDQKAAAASL